MANTRPISNYVRAYQSTGKTPMQVRLYLMIRLDDWTADRCDVAFDGKLMVVTKGVQMACKPKQFKGRGGFVNQVTFISPLAQRHSTQDCGWRVEGDAVVIRMPNWWPDDARRGYCGGYVLPDAPVGQVRAERQPVVIEAPRKTLVPGTPEWRDRVERVTWSTARAVAEEMGMPLHDYRDLQRMNERRRAKGEAQLIIPSPRADYVGVGR